MRSIQRTALVAAVAAAFAGGGVGAADWTQFGYDAAHSGFNPAETTLSASNVAKLATLYHVDLPSSIDSAPGRGSKCTGASTCVPAWSDSAIDSALEVNTVSPATFFSEWSPHTVMMTGGCDGWVCVRWNSSRLRSMSSMAVPFARGVRRC